MNIPSNNITKCGQLVAFPCYIIASTGTRTGDSCSVFSQHTVMLLYGVLFPDWIKWAGIPGNVFSILLHEQGEERHGLLTKLYDSDYYWEYRAAKILKCATASHMTPVPPPSMSPTVIPVNADLTTTRQWRN